MKDFYTNPPQFDRARLPQSLGANHGWRVFFTQVMACPAGEGIRIELVGLNEREIHAQREGIRRWAHRLRYRVTIHLRGQVFYVVPKLGPGSGNGKEQQFSYHQIVMEQRAKQ